MATISRWFDEYKLTTDDGRAVYVRPIDELGGGTRHTFSVWEINGGRPLVQESYGTLGAALERMLEYVPTGETL